MLFLHPALYFLSSENIPKDISLIGKAFHTGSVDLGTQFSPSYITQSYLEVTLSSFLDGLFGTSLKESVILKFTLRILQSNLQGLSNLSSKRNLVVMIVF